MDIELLRNLGLTDSEIKVYLALLELGSSTKGPIVDKANVASSKIYELLEKLIQKGLVSTVVKSGVKYFEAAPPSRLLDYVKEKESKLKQQQHDLQHLIPELELKRSMAGIGSETQVFKGMKGAKTAFDDILSELKKGDEYYILAHSKLKPPFQRFLKNFHKKRETQKIKCKVLLNGIAKDMTDIFGSKTYAKVKYTQEDLFLPFAFIIYKDKTLISIGLDEVFIQIKSENLSTGLKNYFDYLWNQQVKVYEGHENVTKFFMNILDDLEEGEEYNILNANLGIEKVPEIISFFKEFHKKRNKKGIKSNFLFNNNMKGIQNEVALSPCEYKYLPTNFKSPLQMTFYKNKLYLSLWAKKSIGILIERQDVVDAFRGYFDGLWNKK